MVRRLFSSIVSFLLVLSLTCSLTTSFGVSAAVTQDHPLQEEELESESDGFEDSTDTSESMSIEQKAAELLAVSDYAEGEVILIKKGRVLRSEECLTTVEGSDIKEVDEDADLLDGQRLSIVHYSEEGKTTKELLIRFLADESVYDVSPNYITTIPESEMIQGFVPYATPNINPGSYPMDANYANISADLSHLQWGFKFNAGDEGYALPEADYSMNIPGWNTYDENDKPVDNAIGVVAVVDTGVDILHPDLKNIVVGMGGNIDMTAYSSKGGSYGYDATDSVTNGSVTHDLPIDIMGHGTHCAGIIAAEWNKFGVSGAASGVNILPVKVVQDGQEGISARDTLRAFSYLIECAENGLNLVAVNCSFGGLYYSASDLIMTNELGKLGVNVIWAAGNEEEHLENVDETGSLGSVHPASLVVNSYNPDNRQSDFSNYGRTTTDIYAPGGRILSTYFSEGIGASANYMPEADTSMIDFIGMESDSEIGQINVKYFERSNWSMPSAQFAVTGSAFCYSGAQSALIDGDLLASVNPYTNLGGREDDSIVWIIEIPEKAGADAVSFKFYIDGKSQTISQKYITVPVMDAQKKYREELVCTITDSYSVNAGNINLWDTTSINDPAAAAQGYSLYPRNGYYTFNLFLFSADRFTEVPDIYIDSICYGNKLSPYAFMQGTSMATPAVTASMAIIANLLSQDVYKTPKTPGTPLTEAERAERERLAKERVAYAMTHVADVDPVYKDGEVKAKEQNSRSGGRLCFSVAESDRTPYVSDVTLSGKNLICEGAALSNVVKAEVRLGDTFTSLPVSAKSENGLTLSLSPLRYSGEYEFRLTNSVGKVHYFRQSVNYNSSPTGFLNGEIIDLPEPFAFCANVVTVGVYNDKLYVFGEADGIHAYSEYAPILRGSSGLIYSYDLISGQFEVTSAFPWYSQYRSISLQMHEGIIYFVLGDYSNGTIKNHVKAYDIEQDTWSDVTSEPLWAAALSAVGCDQGDPVGMDFAFLNDGLYISVIYAIDSDGEYVSAESNNIFRVDMNTYSVECIGDTDGVTAGSRVLVCGDSFFYGEGDYMEPISRTDGYQMKNYLENTSFEHILYQEEDVSAGTVVVGDNVLLIGERSFSDPMASDILVYNTATKRLSCAPVSYSAAKSYNVSAEEYNGSLYILGFASENEHTSTIVKMNVSDIIKAAAPVSPTVSLLPTVTDESLIPGAGGESSGEAAESGELQPGPVDGNTEDGDASGGEAVTEDSKEKVVLVEAPKPGTAGLAKTSEGDTVYVNKRGNIVENKLVTVKGKTYFAGENGVIHGKGFISFNGKKYYAGKNGVIKKSGLFKVNGKLYFANSKGVVAVNKTIKIGNKRYKAGKKGVLTELKATKKKNKSQKA